MIYWCEKVVGNTFWSPLRSFQTIPVCAGMQRLSVHDPQRCLRQFSCSFVRTQWRRRYEAKLLRPVNHIESKTSGVLMCKNNATSVASQNIFDTVSYSNRNIKTFWRRFQTRSWHFKAIINIYLSLPSIGHRHDTVAGPFTISSPIPNRRK